MSIATTSSSLSSVENLPPDVMRRVTKELLELRNDPSEGIHLHLNEADLTDIQCTIDGPAGTPYESGEFRVKLVLPKDFPTSPPKGFFLTKIFHPNVAVSSGEICVDTLKRDWKSSLGLKHIMLTIKCLLIVPNAESALNEDAGRLLLEDYQNYAKRAKMITEIHARPQRQGEQKMVSDTDACTSNKRPFEDMSASKRLNKEKDKVKKALKRL